MKTNDYCHYTEAQVRDSGLLSPERMAEVSAEISARIEPCFDKQGREIEKAFIVNLGTGERMLHPRVDCEHTREYMRRSVMERVLTEAELTVINARCLEAGQTAKDAERFAKAKKVDSWDGGVFYGDEYFASMDDVIDHLASNGDEWPEFVWAAAPKRVITDLRVSEVVEGDISDRGWEDMDTSDLDGVDELQAALDKFVEANKDVVSYELDYSTAILMAAWKDAEI